MTVAETVAAFDFDGTLIHRGSLVQFVARVVGPARLMCGLFAESPRLVATAAGRANRDRTKAAFLRRTLGGRSIDELRAAAVPHARELVARRLRPEMVRRVEWHRDQGHELVVVSASPALYVGLAARELGITTTLASELAVDARGRVTGEILGANVRGPEKVRRLREWLGDRTVTLWAYGDSEGDRELLAAADHPVYVGRRGVRRASLPPMTARAMDG